MGINRYYLPRASFAEMLSAFAAQRKAKDETESQLKAQASAQENQAIAGAATSVIGGVAGGLTARSLGQPQIGVGADGITSEMQPGLGRLDQFALASSFVPGLGRASATAMGLSDREFDRQRQANTIQGYKDLETLRSQNDAYLLGVEAYTKKYGEAPSMAAAQGISGFAPGAIQPQSEFGVTDAASGVPQAFEESDQNGVPLPSINPMSTQAYRKAQQTVQAIDTMRARPMPAGERQEFEAAAGPVYAQAQQVLRRSQPPPPPSDYAGMRKAGALNGGVTEMPGGGFLYHNGEGLSYAAGSKNGTIFTGPSDWDQMAPEKAQAARDNYLRNRVSNYESKLDEGYSFIVQNDGQVDELKPEKKEQTLFQKTMEDGFKSGPEGDVPFSDPEKLKASLNALALMGELPPQVQKGLDNLEAKFKAGDLTLDEVRETTLQIVGLYGTIPQSMQPRMLKYKNEVAPQAPPSLPSEREMSPSEAMRRKRLGIPTAESVQRDEIAAAKEQERASRAQETGRVEWEKLASRNMNPFGIYTHTISVIGPDGVVRSVNRERDLETQVRALVAAGYQVPGLDGEEGGVLAPQPRLPDVKH